MSISVLDLRPGDRVVLNCPKARIKPKREAEFEGLYNSIEELRASMVGHVLYDLPGTASFIAGEKACRWARFLLQTEVVDGVPRQLRNGFVVDADGGLREEEGRRVFIERRVRVGQG